MGLRAVGQKAINAAFNAAGDAKTEVVYRQKTQGVFNPATDDHSETVVDTELDIIYDSAFKANEFGDLNTDFDFTGAIKGTIKAAPLLPDTPKTEDLIIDTSNNNVEYRVKGIKKIGPFGEAIGYELLLVKNSG